MQIITDLHLHSKYSRATSQKLDLAEISYWASLKGIDIVSTADWTHPLWFREIKNNLKEINQGIYKLKNPRPNQKNPVYFILSTEISSIYSQGGKVRRVHNVVYSPSIQTSKKIIDELVKRGAKLMSDGRPIIGISSKDLLELCLSIDQNIMFIPAHIWTPWFSMFGSKSGFDSVKECFEDLSKYIYAIETGLSSDPIMNWQVADIEDKTIVSFSDAHSGQKLGREATVFVPKTNLNNQLPISHYSFNDFASAIKQKPNSKLKVGYTIEFFPEEGKYHWSGHRKCGIRFDSQQLKKNGPICPKCKKPLTIGVENRIFELSNKVFSFKDVIRQKNKNGLVFIVDKQKKHRPFVSIIPLLEILTDILGSPTKAFRLYLDLVTNLAPEFDILLKIADDKIKQFSSPIVAKAIMAIRKRQVLVDPGYDGVFGTIKPDLAKDETSQVEKKQQVLF